MNLTLSDRVANGHEAAGYYNLAAIGRMTEHEKHTALLYLAWLPEFEGAIRYIVELRQEQAEKERT